MKQKVVYFVVTLVAMFGCLGSVQAQNWTWTGETWKDSSTKYYLRQASGERYITSDNKIVENINSAALWTISGTSGATIQAVGGQKIHNENQTWTLNGATVSGSQAYSFTTKAGLLTYYIYISNSAIKTTTSKNTASNTKNWYLISEDQKNAHDRYVEAYNEASTYVNGLTDTELKNYLQTNIINANNSAQYSDADKKTQALNSVKDYVKVPLNVNTMGSFVAPFDVELPEGVTAWITNDSKVSDGYLTITQATLTDGKLPANTPVILRGTGSQTYYGKTTGKQNEKGNGFLVGVYKETTVPQGNYVLQNQTGEIMLYKVESGDIKLNAYRAYLDGSKAKDAKLRLLFSDETTGISSVGEESSISAIYSASGVKFDTMQKGLNIIKMSDGSVKKVMVK